MSESYDYLNIRNVKTLPSPEDLRTDFPISSSQQKFIASARNQVENILNGQDPRFLIIVGPCSIHNIAAAKEYAQKLQQFAQTTQDQFCIVMRTYFEKPRTVLGWKGFLYDPHLNQSHDLITGLRWTRQLLLDLAEMELPVAIEFLDPAIGYYLGDLISWGCIGARTAASQTHRQLASGLSMPVAFKNSTEGSVDIAINGVISASLPHHFIGMNEDGHISMIQTHGNACGHIVLRGGETGPNYDPESISSALERLQKAGLPPRLLVDCSHDNSLRNHEQQVSVFQSVIHQVMEGNNTIRGVLLESNLYAGNQPINADPSRLRYGVSLTDPCLDWTTTEKLLSWGYSALKRERLSQHSEESFASHFSE